jgi:uncharacterized membrane protein
MSSAANRPRPRIESLTDLIFGLALSIGALGLLNNKPANTLDLLGSVSFFAFSFFILIFIWLRYTDTTSVLPIETPVTRTLNILLLFLVALEPYLFNLIGGTSGLSGNTASIAYAVDIGAIYAILASFSNILASQKRGLVEPSMIRKYRVIRDLQILVAAIFWISILPQFSTPVLTFGTVHLFARYFLWATTLVFSRGTLILRRLRRL